MTLVNVGPFREGTIPAALTVTITDSAGTAISVTGLTVKCMIRRVNATTADDDILGQRVAPLTTKPEMLHPDASVVGPPDAAFA